MRYIITWATALVDGSCAVRPTASESLDQICSDAAIIQLAPTQMIFYSCLFGNTSVLERRGIEEVRSCEGCASQPVREKSIPTRSTVNYAAMMSNTETALMQSLILNASVIRGETRLHAY